MQHLETVKSEHSAGLCSQVVPTPAAVSGVQCHASSSNVFMVSLL